MVSPISGDLKLRILGGDLRWRKIGDQMHAIQVAYRCKIPLNRGVAPYWQTIVAKLRSAGWEVRWTEAMHDAEPGWTAIATREKERHSTHANDLTLAFQELEASCFPNPPPSRPELPRKRAARQNRLN